MQPRPAAQRPANFRRQEPVSCTFCRRKKLRCSRQHPCSNCVARKLTCEREGGPVPNPSNQAAAARSSENGGDESILARLCRLEEHVARLDAAREQTYPLTPLQTTPSTGAAEDVEAPSATEVTHRLDTKKLEDVGTQENLLLLDLADKLHYQVAPVADIITQANWPNHSRTVFLPPKELAIELFETYCTNVEHLHHVIYVPRARLMLLDLYGEIARGAEPHPGQAALLLSVVASTAAFQVAAKRAIGIDNLTVMTVHDAEAVSLIWAKRAIDCLDYSRRVGIGRLEDLQAAITVFFLLYNLEGFSRRARTGLANGLALARDLGLHKIDHPDKFQREGGGPRDEAETEIQRRVWWHIAATDWQLAISGGPLEGTYSVHPRHVLVNRPRNITDEQLETEPPTFAMPLDVPTPTSYLIQRIRLAEICRKIVDTVPLSPGNVEQLRYEDLMALDAEFEKFFANLPPFFRLGSPWDERYQELFDSNPAIFVHRHTINLIASNRRCKLHHPLLIRGFTNPMYRRSRKICLDSARTVIKMKDSLEGRHVITCTLLSLSGVYHHLFFATISLVMDLCQNPSTSQQEDDERRAEVVGACRSMNDVRHRSPLARRCLESLMEVLSKHKVKLNIADMDMEAPEAARDRDRQQPAEMQDPTATDSEPNPLTYDFDELWQSYIDYGPTLDAPGWEELFSDLDTSQ